ncbi:MAG: DUF3445 domain-containing protein [Agriterribacter sp.]
MKYLPFLTGKYSTAPGLIAIEKNPVPTEKFIFQLDDEYKHYIENKTGCRKEDIYKYYCTSALLPDTISRVNKYLTQQLSKEYPGIFTLEGPGKNFSLHNNILNETIRWNDDWVNIEGDKYVSLFDALCCQVQEDIAVVQIRNNEDWLTAIHLCSPNHWSPTEKCGKTFEVIHAPIPGMDKTMQQHPKILSAIIQKGPFTRFAWGIATDNRLNHHPVPPPGTDSDYWNGRLKGDDLTKFYVRTERQNLVGFAEENAFLFTIRTYFYDIDELDSNEKKLLWEAVDTMPYESKIYKGINKMEAELKRKLDK